MKQAFGLVRLNIAMLIHVGVWKVNGWAMSNPSQRINTMTRYQGLNGSIPTIGVLKRLTFIGSIMPRAGDALLMPNRSNNG